MADYATNVLQYITPLSDHQKALFASRRLAYYQSETLVSVVHALLDDFGLLPVAHVMHRTFGKSSLPCSLLAFAAAVVS